jgi:DNA-binding NtrC family response regulator
VTLCSGGTITADLIAPWVASAATRGGEFGRLREGRMLEDLERRLIEQTLARFGGHRAKSAKALGMGVRTLGMKLKQWREEKESLEHRETECVPMSVGESMLVG